jgi:hypothetical protein
MYKIHSRNFHLQNPSTISYIECRTVDAPNPDILQREHRKKPKNLWEQGNMVTQEHRQPLGYPPYCSNLKICKICVRPAGGRGGGCSYSNRLHFRQELNGRWILRISLKHKRSKRSENVGWWDTH